MGDIHEGHEMLHDPGIRLRLISAVRMHLKKLNVDRVIENILVGLVP
jgi:hypothetical protein